MSAALPAKPLEGNCHRCGEWARTYYVEDGVRWCPDCYREKK